MREPIMKITDHYTGEVYWLSGHDASDAIEGFGQDIDIQLVWACDESAIREELWG